MTVGHGHAWVIRQLTRVLRVVEQYECFAQVQLPITLPPDNEPEPDAAIVRGTPDDYRDRHPGPGDVLCVIEVADSSLEHDRTTKQRIYAEAGIPQYVIINLVDGSIEDYQEPRSSAGRYARSVALKKQDSLKILLSEERSMELRGIDLLP
jgi:Uma2 family endonuclease